MQSWIISRPTTYAERETMRAHDQELGLYKKYMECKTERIGKKLMKIIEQTTLYSDLRLEETN